jgi:hypothetical protein
MAATTVALPFNLQTWIDQYLPQSLGAIGNKEVFIWCEDIEVGIKEVSMAFNADEALRTCKQCDAVLADPTKIQHWQ